MQSLFSLSVATWGTLSNAERGLIQAASEGTCCDLGGLPVPPSTLEEQAKFFCDQDRIVRPELVAWLCSDPSAVSLVASFGLCIDGAIFTNPLDLSFMHVPFPLAFVNCLLPELTNLTRTRTQSVDLSGSQLVCLKADGLDVGHNVKLSDGFSCADLVELSLASIGGHLVCRGGTFSCPDGFALILDHTRVRGSVWLTAGFRAEGGVSIFSVEIGGDLDCQNGHFHAGFTENALVCDGSNVGGQVKLAAGFSAKGTVRLRGLKVGSDLVCRGGSFEGANDKAIVAGGIITGGSVLLDSKFRALGSVDFQHAQIGAAVECSEAEFRNPHGQSLTLDSASIGRSVFLNDGFHSTGEVVLNGTQINNNLQCNGGTFHNPGSLALKCSSLQVRNDVFLNDGFEARGEVRFRAAAVGGQFACRGAHLSNPGQVALDLNGASAGNILISRADDVSKGVSIHGLVVLSSASVRTSMSFSDVKFEGSGTNGFEGTGLTVAGSLLWSRVSFNDESMVSLAQASVGELLEPLDEDVFITGRNWPKSGQLQLEGFSYDRLPNFPSGSPIATWESVDRGWLGYRLRWIDLQGGYSPQPFEQLIGTLRQMGHESEARVVAIEKQNALLRSGILNRRQKVRKWLLGFFLGYGYRLGRLLVPAGIILSVAFVMFWFGFSTERVLDDTGSPLDGELVGTALFGVMYSLDVFLPVISLGLQQDWNITLDDTFGWSLLIYEWLLIAVGWILTTLLVVGLTGLVRKD